jgi:hypothetical protein
MNKLSYLRGRDGMLVCALVLSACTHRNPLDLTVNSSSEVSFDMWRADAADRLSPPQLKDFDEALQEIRFEKMAENDKLRREEIEEAVLQAVDGRSVRKVLEMGFAWELRILEDECNEHLEAMRINAQMKTRPGDTESQRYLSELHDRQVAKLQEESLEIARVRSRLVASALPGDTQPQTGSSVTTPLDARSVDERPVRLP